MCSVYENYIQATYINTVDILEFGYGSIKFDDALLCVKLKVVIKQYKQTCVLLSII